MPEQDERFVVGADPAEGGDFSAFVVLSRKTADVVMSGQSKEESSQLGHTLNHIGKWFYSRTGQHPSIGVERNTGSATIYVLKSLNYPNIFKTPASFTKERQPKKAPDNYGWHTNVATRPKMLDDLAMAVRQKVVGIPDERIVSELFTFIRNEGTGKPEHEVSCNDDLVFSLAIAWQLYSLVGSGAEEIQAEQEWAAMKRRDGKKDWSFK